MKLLAAFLLFICLFPPYTHLNTDPYSLYIKWGPSFVHGWGISGEIFIDQLPTKEQLERETKELQDKIRKDYEQN